MKSNVLLKNTKVTEKNCWSSSTRITPVTSVFNHPAYRHCAAFTSFSLVTYKTAQCAVEHQICHSLQCSHLLCALQASVASPDNPVGKAPSFLNLHKSSRVQLYERVYKLPPAWTSLVLSHSLVKCFERILQDSSTVAGVFRNGRTDLVETALSNDLQQLIGLLWFVSGYDPSRFSSQGLSAD